ncbi:response regulator transcription factor [Roseiconus lacunae]|uniref:Response regulator transcription factor n=1 Tax=Roseiconus lacunae TaxID=2605694 RepID=A0ABT7PD75_9BACT|nr:response regulator transcription factor [Roseiconus lacunae]MCD0459757.1 response regulator transcription factor [Roseiconus lacunae]MDM4014454.1 response regulator transcription factor [Roseiconus lacunae]WRQ49769.1 response regulator transcription factor [Stieleria sp. HD01]
MTHRILIAEDDRHTRKALAEVLAAEGYEVIEAADGLNAKAMFDRDMPDMACLDVMMPGMSGYDVCKYFRQKSPTMPILFITAKAEEIDKVVGLELGGDDYIVKPFGTKEVVARIRAVARRSFVSADTNCQTEFTDEPFRMGDLEVLPKELRARRQDDTVTLTRREVLILQTLAAKPGEVITRRELFQLAWEDDHLPNSRTIDQTISQLRKRIERDPKHPKIIHTVYGVGYRFE